MDNLSLNTSDLLQATVTALLAIIIYVMGQIVEKIFIIPIKEQRGIIGKISFALTYYANRFPFNNDAGDIINKSELNQASDKVRELAASLRSTRYKIPFYARLSKYKIVLSENKIIECSTSLIGWSNSFYENGRNNREHFRKEIAKCLDINML